MEQIHDIKEAVSIYKTGLAKLIGNQNEWNEFLKFNSRFYKYKFHENLLLYSQDKNVTVCATFDEWKKVGRYVKPKPYSITLKTIYSQSNKLYLKSVFDISSTNSRYDIEFKLWETNEKDALEILQNGLDMYEKNDKDTLDDVISLYMYEVIRDEEFIEKLELPQDKIDDDFLITFIESVKAVVINRCGGTYEPDLSRYKSIQDVSILKRLGYIVNKCSYDLIKTVELEIKQRLENKEWEEIWYERNRITKNEESTRGNKTSEISRLDNGGDNQRTFGNERTGDNERRTDNRRKIKDKISKTRYRGIFRTSTIRKYDSQSENGINRQYDRRKSKRNVEYDEGVVQTTLFNLQNDNEKLKEQTPSEIIFAGYKLGDIIYIGDTPEYITNIDMEKNEITLALTPEDGVTIVFSLEKFDDILNSNPLNKQIIEKNKTEDLEKLTEITDVNPFDEIEEKAELPIPFKIPIDLKEDSIGLKKKYEENIEAIKLLYQLEDSYRKPTDEEKLILAQYNGWGGLSKEFEETSGHYNELQGLLTKDEFESAKDSAVTSFYTEPYIVDFMYKAIQRFGIKGKCQILEPSAGIGNFLGRLPTELQKSKITAIELDDLTGRMLRKIYDNVDVKINGYENTKLNNNYYDIAISNIPFGEYGVYDKSYDSSLQIHDYYFEKTIDKVKPGGIIAFITSRYTLDKKDSKVRKYIDERTNFIGAVRLPNTAFKKIANTEAIADIIFLQKKGKELEYKEDWIDAHEIKDGININNYFATKKYMIKGDIDFKSGQYGDEVLKISPTGDLKEQLEETLKMLPENIIDMEELNQTYVEEKGEFIEVGEEYQNVKDYTYTIIDGKVYYRINDNLYEQHKSLSTLERIKALHNVRTTLRELINIENKDVPDIDILPYQAKLNQVYDDFVKKYGHITDRGNSIAFRNDADYPLLISLEKEDKKTKEIIKTDIFTKRTIKPFKEITHTETAKEGLIVSINQRGKVDIKYIMKLCNKDYDTVINDLKGLIYHNPDLAYGRNNADYDGWETADQYLSRKCC